MGGQLTPPVMRRRTGFDTNQARIQASKEPQHLRPADVLADYHRTGLIEAVNLCTAPGYLDTR